MINAGFGCLVNITNFEFLCRKLNFGHVGIVQNIMFFIKSARRFRKAMSTLASQRVTCIPGIPRTALLNLRAMNDVERYARLENLEHKITGTNNKILTVPIHVRPLKHVVGRDQCRKMTQYSYLCIKPWKT